MKENIILLDGAIGTSLWGKAEQRGIARKPVWIYNIEHPEIVGELAREYIDAGSRVILSNTFGANRPSVEHSSGYSCGDVVRAGVRIAKEAAAGKARVALDAGPLSELLEPYGDLTEEECAELYEEQLGAGMEEKPDLILLETFMDVEMMRVAASVALRYGVPVLCSLTFEQAGRTMMGNTVQQAIDTLAPLGIAAIGMNCSLGPALALPVIREFSEKTDLPLIFKPNAGKPVLGPDGKEVSPYSAEMFVDEIRPALEFVSWIGGCCGTDPSYIRALKAVM